MTITVGSVVGNVPFFALAERLAIQEIGWPFLYYIIEISQYTLVLSIYFN
jgi:hypothetical protein